MNTGGKSPWSATAAHLRAVVAGVVLAAVALIGPRLDMAILAAPFVAAATYGAMRRPRQVPGVAMRVDAATLAEGQATSARVTATGVAEDGAIVAVEITADRWTHCNPAGAARVVMVHPPSSEVAVVVRPVRWGRHELRARDVTVTSPLGAYRTVTSPRTVVVTTLPLAEMFAATDALPRPAALVGLHRSRRQGEGSELAEVRAFRPGDRLRRINWPVSSRVGVLHVTAAWSDRDTEVVLLLDTEHDLGISDGVDGRASSLDVAVRAAAAIADHYVRAGDRVSLTDLGARIRSVPAGGGRQHLRRLLDVLVAAAPSRVRSVDPSRLRRVRTGSLVIAFSPLLGGAGVAQVAALVRRGHAVVVIDTLPGQRFRRRCIASLADTRLARAVARTGGGDRPLGRARGTRRQMAWARHARRGVARREPDVLGAEDPLMVANWISSMIGTMRRMPAAALALRVLIAMAAGVALLGTTTPAWDAPDGYVVIALVAAVVCTLVPDSGGGLVLVLAVAACWVARAPDEVSPAIVATALGLLGVHVGTALAASFPATATIDGAVARRWGRWTAVLAAVVLAVGGAAAALEAWSRPGSVVVTIAGLAGLAALAWWWSARPVEPGSS